MITVGGSGGSAAISLANPLPVQEKVNLFPGISCVLASFSMDLPPASPINAFETIKININTYLAGLAPAARVLSNTYYTAENNAGGGAVTIRSLWALVITAI